MLQHEPIVANIGVNNKVGGLVKTKGVDDLMGNVTAFMYSDLKEGLSSIKDPEVQTRTLGQARMVLGSVNTMMPDPQAPNSMLPPAGVISLIHAGPRGRHASQTLASSFSLVSMPNFAIEVSFESSRRDLHNTHLSTDLRSQIAN